MAALKVLGRAGHVTTEWDVLDEASQIAAKAVFNAEIKQGATAFAVTTPGEPAEKISEFDPQAKEILITRQMAGGAV